MPQVASKASVLKPQHSGPTQRERMGEPKDSSSPFSTLLAEAGGDPAPTRHLASRPNGTSASQRTEPPRGQMQRTDAERPQATDGEPATDAAAPAAATEATATEQSDEAAKQLEIATGQAEATPESTPAESTDDPAGEENAAIDPALAVSTEASPSPAQPVAPETPIPAATATTPAVTAPADADAVEAAAVAGVTAPAPTGDIAAVSPDAAAGVSEPTAPPAQPQNAPQVPKQSAQPATPVTPDAKPASVTPAATAESANEQAQPSATAETDTPVEPIAGAQNAETKSAPEKPAHTDAPSPPAARPSPDASEHPRTAGAASDLIQAAQQPTPDGSQLAHLQAGRDVGQATVAAATHAQSAAASNQLTSTPVPLESIAVEIASRALSGSNRFEIRLDPPELGRIDVRLDIDRSGNVTSRLVVEKAETLDVLRRDAHQLERALQDAGLKTSDNGLQFSLRDQSSAERHDRGDSNGNHALIADPELPAAEGAALAYGLTLRGGSGVDIRV